MPKQSDRQLAQMTANYYGMISLIDHNVGRILLELERLGLDHDVVVAPALAVMREAAFGRPRLADDFDGLIEALGRLFDRDAEAVELGLPIALADAEIEAAAREQIERRRLLGDEHGIVPGQHDDGGAEPNVARLRREIGKQGERGRDLAVAGEMMLDQEHVAEAESVGLDHVVDEAVVAEAVFEADRALGARAAEQAELHGHVRTRVLGGESGFAHWIEIGRAHV